MDSGICYIKEEYRIPDTKPIKNSSEKDPKEDNKRKHEDQQDDENDNENKKFEKDQKGNKRERKRGQNKKRPVYKEDRTLHLCHSLINGDTLKKCEYPKCRYVHDLEKYLASKGEDLGAECYVFKTKGYCPRGVTCRFAKCHLNSEGCNIKQTDYDSTMPPSTFNGITADLQVRLRKREYDFCKSKDLVEHFFKERRNAIQSKQKADALTASSKVETAGTTVLVKDDDAVENTVSETEQIANAATTELSSKEVPTTTETEIRNSQVEKPVGSVVTDDIKETLKKPAVDFANKLILSPLTTVGNLPFRRICKEFGADITCGEMACAVPLVKGLTQEWALTKRHESEDVFGVQLCGNNPTLIAQAAQLLQETAKVDYLDLNIGCPIDLIYQQGGGSALMRRTNVLEVTVRSCSTLSPSIPFTVKMRTGIYADSSVAHQLMPLVEEWGASAVTLHGRSREQRYTKNANWQYIEECASKVKRIPVIGNGDIMSFVDYNEKKLSAPHVSSFMIGRGALIKPWIFEEIKQQRHLDPSSTERFEMLQKYVNYGLEHWGSDTKGVENTRRFLLEWQSFLYRYIPYGLLENPPQLINQRPEAYRGRDEMETLMSSHNSADWVKLSEMLLGRVPEGFTFVPKHKANAF